MRPMFVETWLPLLRDALASEGSFRWTLCGDSMSPTLPTKCTIEIRPLLEHVRPGTLIVFAAGDSLIAHRLVARRGAVWIAQGDGRLAPDAPIGSEQVFGRVAAAFTGNRPIWPRRSEPLLALAWVVRYHFLRPVRSVRRRIRTSFGGGAG
jgi:hypothetical protein